MALSGDGMIGALADALRDAPAAPSSGVLPGGRGNDLARVLGIPDDPARPPRSIAAGHARPIDLGLVAGRAARTGRRAGVRRDRLGRLRQRRQPHRQRGARPGSAASSTPTARCGRCVAWRPARFEIELDPPGERHAFTAYSVGACQLQGLRRRHARRARRAARRRPARGGGARERRQARVPDAHPARRSSSGTHVHEPERARVPRARGRDQLPTARSTMYADGDPIGELPVRVRALPGAVTMLTPAGGPQPALAQPLSPASRAIRSADGRHARRQARARARRGRDLAPARRRRHERAGQGADAPRSPTRSARSARAWRAAAC